MLRAIPIHIKDLQGFCRARNHIHLVVYCHSCPLLCTLGLYIQTVEQYRLWNGNSENLTCSTEGPEFIEKDLAGVGIGVASPLGQWMTQRKE